MSNKLDEIRAKLAAMENKPGSNTNQPQTDSALYPFWNIQEGESALLRFLPDADPDNTFFWAERQMINLKFPGVKGGEQNKPVTVKVPCGEMYGDTCPVLTEVRPMFKDPSLEDLARSYWKKRSYIFQGFVKENPLAGDESENPIRRFVIGPQIFNIIKTALMDPDMESIPTDYENGTDFRLSKSSKGGYADYSTSKWRNKESALTEEDRKAIDTHGLYTLKDFIPARPSQEHYAVIAEMFAASVDGELYDPVRWGNFYKPYGVEVPDGAAQPSTQKATQSAQKTEAAQPAPTPTPAPAPAASESDNGDDLPWKGQEEQTPEPQSADPKKSTDDILAMIRNRSK